MRLRYTRRARQHLTSIRAYIAEQNPVATQRVMIQIHASLKILGTFPFSGHVGRIPGTREFVVPRLPYVVVHRVDADRDTIEILGVYHAAQSREP